MSERRRREGGFNPPCHASRNEQVILNTIARVFLPKPNKEQGRYHHTHPLEGLGLMQPNNMHFCESPRRVFAHPVLTGSRPAERAAKNKKKKKDAKKGTQGWDIMQNRCRVSCTSEVFRDTILVSRKERDVVYRMVPWGGSDVHAVIGTYERRLVYRRWRGKERRRNEDAGIIFVDEPGNARVGFGAAKIECSPEGDRGKRGVVIHDVSALQSGCWREHVTCSRSARRPRAGMG